MNSITTKATAASPKSSVAPPAGRRWMTVVFMQGEEADTVLDMIDRNGPEAAIHHLSRSDYGDKTRDAALDNGYVYDEVPESPTDRVVHDNVSGYALMYNYQFGYVSLLRHFDAVVEIRSVCVAPPEQFGFERHRSTRRPNEIRL
ncbi:hypothetical protein ACFUTX_05215 [Microbacterium sp. NPDC057407]|uniref:hypothetical protein n=1 Tax=unclassified Microbacterium TaxID=2609290 RepID=UPI0035E2D5AA